MFKSQAVALTLVLLFGSVLSLFPLSGCSLGGNPPEYSASDAPGQAILQPPTGDALIRPPRSGSAESAWSNEVESVAGVDLLRLQPGDVLNVAVVHRNERQGSLSGQFVIGPDNTIVWAERGRIDVKSKRVEDVKSALSQNLADYLIGAQVDVWVADYAPRNARVMGAASTVRSGVVNLLEHRTLLAALMASGWSDQSGGVNRVTVLRDGRSRSLALDTEEARLRADRWELNPGDTLLCHANRNITLVGEFGSPVVLPAGIGGRLSVFEALVQAGGLTERADRQRLRVLDPDGQVQMLDLNKLFQAQQPTRDVYLFEGQTLIANPTQLHTYYVFGMTASPSKVIESEQPLTLMQLIAQCGIPPFGPRISDARLVRNWPSTPKVYKVDIEGILEGNAAGNLVLESGDVLFIPETGLSYAVRIATAVLSPVFGTLRGVGDAVESAEQIGDSGN